MTSLKKLQVLFPKTDAYLNLFLQFQTMRLLMARLNLLNSGVVVNLVAPLKDLTIEGKDEKTAANVVGM